MSKRYKLLKNTYDCHMFPTGQRIKDLDNEKELTQKEVVDLLNSFSDVVLAYDKRVAELKRENEQLRKENKRLHYVIVDLQDKLGMSEKVIIDE